MPFKIYTYADPYLLNKTDFWDEIKSLPHFCNSRTLVNGFRSFMRDSIEGLICPLDDLVNSKGIYAEWTKNISFRLKQYSSITQRFNERLAKGEITEKLLMALENGQNDFLDAIRLFTELGISPDALDGNCGTAEQKLLIDIYKEILFKKDNCFSFPRTPSVPQIKDIISELAHQELEDFSARQKMQGSRNADDTVKETINWFKRMIARMERKDYSAIVIHGVHQFSPVQLRLIMELHNQGFTIIFLYNYQKEYSKIYASWNYIYSLFSVPIHNDTNVPAYRDSSLLTPGNACAVALGKLIEGTSQRENAGQNLYSLYSQLEFDEYANLTEYAHYVSDRFDTAYSEYKSEQNIVDRGIGFVDTSSVLSYSQEQIYTANRDIHDMLKMYYPQFSNKRHFLSYPIGQFFSAIYKLWNWQRNEIDFDIKLVGDCFSSGILHSDSGERLLENLEIIEPVLSYKRTYSGAKAAIEKLLEQYRQVMKMPNSMMASLSIYNKYRITEKDIKLVLAALNELNEISIALFSNADHSDRIDFKNHFDKLELFIRDHSSALRDEEEKALINALIDRFDSVKGVSGGFSGTMRDLRNGLYYFLKQKDDDEDRVDWIVKNFEQIDGDILQSRSQYQHHKKKKYHFACVSDKDFGIKVDDILPWPLTDVFINTAYCPVDLQFQVYYASLSERSSFLLYALFYGLLFNKCESKLSYVRECDDKDTEPLTFLKVLGLMPKEANNVRKVSPSEEVVVSFKYDANETCECTFNQAVTMLICPHRYFMDYILSREPVLGTDFLFHNFFESIIFDETFQEIADKPKKQIERALPVIVKKHVLQLKDYFFFWREIDFHDMEDKTCNYIKNKLLTYTPPKTNPNIVRKYNQSHSWIRRTFGKAKFEIGVYLPSHPVSEYDNLIQLSENKRIYSLHNVDRSSSMGKLRTGMNAFFDLPGNSGDYAMCYEAWCIYCPERNVCLKSYQNDK